MTVQNEISELEDLISKKIPLSPSAWLDKIGRVVVMMSEETDKLYTLQREVAQKKVILIQEGKSVAEAKATLEATEVYENMQKQRARCNQIEELIRIGKLQSKLKSEEYFGSNL